MAVQPYGMSAAFLFAMLCLCCHGEKVALIPLGSHTVAGALGSDLDLICKKPKDQDVQWLLPSGEPASKNISSDHVTQIDSNLRITNITWDDRGDYMCTLENHSHNETVVFKVYEMPTYFVEGMVILSINGVLLLLFLICLVVSTMKSKHRRQAEKNRRVIYKKKTEAYS